MGAMNFSGYATARFYQWRPLTALNQEKHCAALLRSIPTKVPTRLPARSVLPQTVACKCLKGLAPQVGLEPTTLRLTAECSTIELLRSNARRAIFITPNRTASCQFGRTVTGIAAIEAGSSLANGLRRVL
jgi:hypothetical protein